MMPGILCINKNKERYIKPDFQNHALKTTDLSGELGKIEKDNIIRTTYRFKLIDSHAYTHST